MVIGGWSYALGVAGDDENIERDGEVVEAGNPGHKLKAGASPTKTIAKNEGPPIDTEGIDQLGKNTSSSGGLSASMANMGNSLTGLLPTPRSETANTSQSSNNNSDGSQSGMGNNRTYLRRRTWFSVGSKRQGVDSTFQNSNGVQETDRWLLRDATGGFTKTKIN